MSTPTKKSPVFKLSLMMFMQFWIWGAWFLTVPNFLNNTEYMAIGLSPWYAYTAHPISCMLAPFFIGFIADRLFNTEKVLTVLFLLAGGTMLLMPIIAGLSGTVKSITVSGAPTEVLEVTFLGITMFKHIMFEWLTLIHFLFFMPTLALTASLSFRHLPNGSAQFPIVSLWGTFGWIFAGLALPFFFNSYEIIDGVKQVSVGAGQTSGQFLLGGITCVILAIFCLTLPKTPAPKKGQKVNISDLFFMDVWKLFKRPSFAVFVLCSMLVCIPLQAYYAFLQTQMEQQGISNISIWKNAGT